MNIACELHSSLGWATDRTRAYGLVSLCTIFFFFFVIWCYWKFLLFWVINTVFHLLPHRLLELDAIWLRWSLHPSFSIHLTSACLQRQGTGQCTMQPSCPGRCGCTKTRTLCSCTSTTGKWKFKSINLQLIYPNRLVTSYFCSLNEQLPYSY